MNILIVCAGNTCRSPMAAGLIRAMAGLRGLTLNVQSAGLAHQPGDAVTKNAVRAMQEWGIDISDDYSKPVTAEILQWAEVVVPVQRNHADHLVEDFPESVSKIRLLEFDIPDPYGRPMTEYRRVRDTLRELLARLLESLDARPY